MASGSNSLDGVVLISDYSHPVGGAEVLALALARRLAGQGTPVTFFSGDTPDGPLGEGIESVGLGSADLLTRGALDAVRTGLYNRRSGAALAEWIARHDTPRTIYHVHNWTQILSPSIFSALVPVASRVVLHAHDYALACPNSVFFNFPRNKSCSLKPLGAACLITNCDKRSYPQKMFRVGRQMSLVRAISPIIRDAHLILLHRNMAPLMARARGFGATHLVSNPSHPFTATPPPTAQNRGFFYIGQLNAFKGAVDFAKAANRAGVDAHFIGTGPDGGLIESHSPAATHHGWVARDGLAPLLRQARAVVVPSRGVEAYGLVIAEAVTSGIPVIVSDACNLAEDIEALGMGITFKAGSVASLHDALVRVDRDDALVEGMSLAARTHGWNITQTVDDWVDDVRSVYGQMLARDPGSGMRGPASGL